MNGNIIGRAEQSKEMQAKATELERLELVKGNVAIDNKGKVTVDDYIEEAIKQGIASEDKVEDNGDGSKNIITDNGWSVNISPDPDNENNVIITIDGKEGSLKPVISKIDISTTHSSITAKAKVRHLNGGTVEYYYRLHGKTPEDSYKKVEDATNEEATITELIESERYDIKVVATNANGKAEKEKIDIILKELVKKITLNAESTRMAAGYTRTLIATIEPDNAENKELEWTSSDINLATVTDGGSGTFGIYGKVNSAKNKTGKVTITAKAKDGSGVTGSCEVEVVVADEIKTIVGESTPSNENRIVCDEFGNLITIPADFTVVANGNFGTAYSYTGNTSSPSVQDGIVIKDIDDNQFTWVPTELVQNKTGDRNGPSKNIVLGRYNFDIGTYDKEAGSYTGSGKAYLGYRPEDAKLEQSVNGRYFELYNFREGDVETQRYGQNATALNLEGFLRNSVLNSGFYMGRYEASYRSGSNEKDWLPFSKKSTNKGEWYSYGKTTSGYLWNQLNQIYAAATCRNMYKNSNSVVSDLVNSYAWDTTLVFIQTYSDNEKYSLQTSLNSSLLNTGDTGDRMCNIFDMASNLVEWTTEYCNSKTTQYYYPCTQRGGYPYEKVCVAGGRYRTYVNGTYLDPWYDNSSCVGFRPCLFLK